jgi:hypothetical protein
MKFEKPLEFLKNYSNKFQYRIQKLDKFIEEEPPATMVQNIQNFVVSFSSNTSKIQH